MLYQIEIGMKPDLLDPVGVGTKYDILDLGIKSVKDVRFIQIYVIEADLNEPEINRITTTLLADPMVHNYAVNRPLHPPEDKTHKIITVFRKPGVMDPVEASTIKAIADLGLTVNSVHTGKKYLLIGTSTLRERKLLAPKVLANEVIEEIFYGPKTLGQITSAQAYKFNLQSVPLQKMTDDEMLKMSETYQLSLNLKELQTIQQYFKGLGRDPTDAELETIAQTWSEHCKHKTLMGLIEYREKTDARSEWKTEKIDNLLRQTVMKVTDELAKPWCISVFEDNAGIIEFDDEYAVCFKVETHNHPSAIEPYGGAGTGIGGVIRDPLGCGLGAKPILNTDIFCFGPPDLPHKKLPPGILHPKRIMKGVVSGVRDYGNRMGIPTANGAVYFDPRYIGNPLVYCGNVGLMPRDKCFKNPQAGDLILLVGGGTGRDGIHGVTFASVELTEKSEVISSGAVQIGNPITEKKMVDAILQARDEGLYSAITDCGGGGLSSAVGELGSEIGVNVDLEKVPLKYEGLSYTEIWISEAQERMIMAVPPQHKERIVEIFRQENVPATFIGRFTGDKKLVLKYEGNEVANLDMEFLHHGVPKFFREAEWSQPRHTKPKVPAQRNYGRVLKNLLGMWNICSKEWIIRQYDHEVQGGASLKPLQGIKNDGPGDACVYRPRLDSHRGIVVANGMNPKYGDIDTYHMAASAIDEALRNIVAVGGDLSRTALLDNFSWGNTNKPDRLGALVRAARACYDMAKIYETPFISGKDSLNNEYRTKGKTIVIPHSLLISAISVIADVRKVISMDLKAPGNLIYLIGLTKPELGGSHYYALFGYVGNNVPQVDAVSGKRIFQTLSNAMQKGYVRACHDLSEGGLAVAAAEMAFAGEIGMKIDLRKVPISEEIKKNDMILFSESNSRFLVEVAPENQTAFEAKMKDCPVGLIGRTDALKTLRISGLQDRLMVNEPLMKLKEAWQKSLKL